MRAVYDASRDQVWAYDSNAQQLWRFGSFGGCAGGVDAIDRKINLHRRKRAVLEELFKALLHKLMTGEIRAGDLTLPTLKEE